MGYCKEYLPIGIVWLQNSVRRKNLEYSMDLGSCLLGMSPTFVEQRLN
jgi:hypothetical protein